MEILGVGPLELMLVLLIAILVIGPKDIQKTAYTVGRALNRLYKSEGWKLLLTAAHDVQNLPNTLAREAQLHDSLAEAAEGLSMDPRALIGAPPPAPPPQRSLPADLYEWQRPAVSPSDGAPADPDLYEWQHPA